MKLSEMYVMTLSQLLGRMEMMDFKVHTDDSGNIKVIEVKYSPRKEEEK